MYPNAIEKTIVPLINTKTQQDAKMEFKYKKFEFSLVMELIDYKCVGVIFFDGGVIFFLSFFFFFFWVGGGGGLFLYLFFYRR